MEKWRGGNEWGRNVLSKIFERDFIKSIDMQLLNH